MANDNTQRDIVLDAGTYAFVRDRTQSAMKICTGPTTVTPSQSDEPVKFDPKSGRFIPCDISTVIQSNIVAEFGQYVVLKNPALDGKQPKPEMKGTATYALDIGSKVVIPGPADFPLWPRQSAEVVDGHHLKSNQFLLVRIYNEELAKKNWSTAIMRPAALVPPPADATDEEKKAFEEKKAAAAQASPTQSVDLTTGKLHIIKGTDVSFFIPPSGVEVVRENDGKYVRDALTLERMEYAILVDEDGNKRFERGPQVVFPEPTESFQVKDGAKKQNAVELNSLQGLHLKAIADFDDKDHGIKFKAGEEYFVTGDETRSSTDEKIGTGSTIFYPREELAFVRYDGKTKIFAVTVPEGEGRYLMNRVTGEIETIKGPKQLLPNPCKFVIVRRALSDNQCLLWYPGNDEALAYNRGISGVLASAPTTRAGAISEGDYERALKGRSKTLSADSAVVMRSATLNYAGESSRVSGDQKVMGDEFERSSGYTAPRTLTLNTKYQGAIRLNIWTGYAIMVISEKDRRVEVGPKTILLDYDEDLETLAFSTGKPKTTDNLLKTVYLQVENNKVSDVIEVETVEGVKAQVYVSYLVGFEGDSSKWFSVSNYIKLMCDRARSMLKGVVRKLGVEQFYQNSTDIVRDTLLGKSVEGKRAGLAFAENGMRVRDIDVLNVQLLNPQLASKLANAQLQVVDGNIALAAKRRETEMAKELESLTVQQAEAKAETKKRQDELAIELVSSEVSVEMAKIGHALEVLAEQKKHIEAEEALELFKTQGAVDRKSLVANSDLELRSKELEQKIKDLVAQTESTVKRFEAAKGGLTEALVAVADKEVLVKLGQALNIQQIIGGESVSDAVAKIFAGSPVESIVKRMLGGQMGGTKPVDPLGATRA